MTMGTLKVMTDAQILVKKKLVGLVLGLLCLFVFQNVMIICFLEMKNVEMMI